MKKSIYSIVFIVAIIAAIGVSMWLSGLSPQQRQRSSDSGQIERIVSINPAATELIFALDCQNRLVGISDFCLYPPETQNYERLGGGINLNFERVTALQPDLVIIQGKSQQIVDFCNTKGIEIMRMDLWDINGLMADIQILAKKLGRRDKGNELIAKIRSQLKAVQIAVEDKPVKSVFFSFSRTPGTLTGISTVGKGTLLDELVELAGGENIFADVTTAYPVISKEALLRLDPQVIIEPVPARSFSETKRKSAINDWQQLSKIRAVHNGDIYFPDADLILKPGPRIGIAAKVLAECIHGVTINDASFAEHP